MIVGQVVELQGRLYVVVNAAGTLEKLPRVNVWRRLWLSISTRIKPWDVIDVRRFCRRHAGW